MNRQSTLQQRLESVNDLTQLSNIPDDVIVVCLRERFMTDAIYTSIGSGSLAAAASNADSVSHTHAADYRNTTLNEEICRYFQLVNDAYYHVKRTIQDQGTVFSGETGSSKSESRCLATKTILELSVSNPGKKGSQLASQVPAADFVLELPVPSSAPTPLGSANTQNSSSRTLDGLRVRRPSNTISRRIVSLVPRAANEISTSSTVFLLALRRRYGPTFIDDKTQYRYLGQRPGATAPRGGTARDDDALRFEQLKVALKTIGFSKCQTCQLLAVIPHLGNLEFTVDRHRNKDAVDVRNTDVCSISADFLGLQQSELEACLSYKRRCAVFPDPDGVSNNRDELAKSFYSLLFSCLNEYVNQRLRKDDSSTSLALFDLPGLQDMTSRPNSRDQFCVNFANERLRHWTQRRLFESHLPEYQSTRIANYVPQVTYFDSTESRVPHIHRSPLQRTRHHSSENFELNSDFVSLLRGGASTVGVGSSGEASGSINPFVKDVISGKAIAMGPPSERRNHRWCSAERETYASSFDDEEGKYSSDAYGSRESADTMVSEESPFEKDDEVATKPGGCVAGEFRAALDALFETLDEAQARHVFCVNPNDSQLPYQLEGKGQVRSFGSAEIAKRCGVVFEVNMTPEEFCERYGEGMAEVGVMEGTEKERVQQARTASGLESMDIVLGNQQVHFNAPMNPLELEMYHRIKNVIGVNPTFYEYLSTVDADATVDKFSVNRLISAMIHDKKLLGACGETELANAKQSIITMMQVYEYFISHHMAKAFESLFGSVTCLPGCFTLHRLRSPDTHKPLLISNQVIQDYSENPVDTLHMKNLLHLGEDRYLTTLLLKHFPLHKTQFVRDAHAYTVTPDDWKVLLSQRRRWINSTVHNLGELIFLDQLCGFCCFSMRFIVMIDLISTLIQPVTVVYLTYPIVNVARGDQAVPLQSLIMKWDMIGWMFYILAIPAFTFFLPLYSFWRMDDFSWGQDTFGTWRMRQEIDRSCKFDPRAIPPKSWSDYENELWDKESNHSIGSWVPPTKFKNDGYAGRETIYHGQGGPFAGGQDRSYSPAPSQGMYPPPGYQSGRNTPMLQYGMPAPMTPFGAPQSSMLHQPTISRPGSNYLDLPFDSRSPPGMPSDAEIENAVRAILSNVDLNTVTKRELRRQLEEQFGMDLTAKKGVINQAVDRCLAEQAQGAEFCFFSSRISYWVYVLVLVLVSFSADWTLVYIFSLLPFDSSSGLDSLLLV
ncbi:hypothetical protein AAF712_008560 [Marasmius tenuissimus]|uniref:chitin synthase n=1 Tax=Marasmius tenuissimus TaxID=585030 RepID=A0ABR2ZS40_9AGAR